MPAILLISKFSHDVSYTIESDADVAALCVRSFAEPDLYTVRCNNTISRLAAVIRLCMLGNGRN